MKITSIRIKGKKPEPRTMQAIVNQLQAAFNRTGFLTDVVATSSTAIKIGLQGKCFTIDISILGYNARLDSYHKTIKGYTITTLPNWEQREQFNHIVNDVLDSFDVRANIKSGLYTVRKKDTGRINSWWPVNAGNFYPEIVSLDADLEAEGKARLKQHRAEQRKARDQKQIVKVVINGVLQSMTKAEFQELKKKIKNEYMTVQSQDNHVNEAK